MFSIVLLLLLIPSVRSEVRSQVNDTSTPSLWTDRPTPWKCTYCYTKACRCPLTPVLLNCSFYQLNLTVYSSCGSMNVWDVVDFSSRHLRSLDSAQLLSLRMHRLLLQSNFISTIAGQTFDSIADILTELDLSMNSIESIASTWLTSKFIRLERFNLASNQIHSFVHLDDVQLPSLEELNLSRNHLESFPIPIHQWTSLITLDLSFNKLSSIPRFALMGLQNLTWLSVAANRNLSCITQDSFKHLKSLRYLDLSETNLFDFDACVFIQLTGLRTLRMESLLLNCSSCWLPIAKKHPLQLFGQCLFNTSTHSLDTLTDKQLAHVCGKSSIDCSVDSCEPGSLVPYQKSERQPIPTKEARTTRTQTMELILGLIFGMIALAIVVVLVVLWLRWKKGRTLICCHFYQTTTSIAEATRRRREHRKQIIDSNPAVIESVVTHGGDMNVPPHSHHNDAYFNNETSNNKRKLYNPMFADSPTGDNRHAQQVVTGSNDQTSSNNQFFSSEHL